jgi:dTMP kinase
MQFLVLEGLDGSGKSTQIKLLTDYLKTKGQDVKFLHFPRTDAPFYGDLVARFLRGELGKIDEVNPYLVALIYAGDRSDAKEQIKQWMEEGHLVVVDRYVYSNIAFQCAKLSERKEQAELKDWIKSFEFEHNNIAKPDVSLFLDVPFAFTENKLKNQRDGDDREYLKGKSDIHEADLSFQQKVRDIYLWQVEEEEDFKLVSCHDDNQQMLAPELIFERIKETLKI